MLEHGAGTVRQLHRLRQHGQRQPSRGPRLHHFCLRYWVMELTSMVSASTWPRSSAATGWQPVPNPPLMESMAVDPLLADTKLIAEAWDAAGLYQVGSLPSWAMGGVERAFRDDMRKFWRATPGMLGAGDAAAGQPDLYEQRGRGRTTASTSSPGMTASRSATWCRTTKSTTWPTAKTTATATTRTTARTTASKDPR